MRKTSTGLLRCVALSVAVAGAGLAKAQNVGDNFVSPNLPLAVDRGRNTGVLDRDRPEYTAMGIKAGGFTLLPKLDLSAGYTDNVYETASPKKDDAFFTIAPSLRATSNWSRNALNFNAGADLMRFASQTRRNQNGWHVGSDGRYDISGSTVFSASVATRRATEPATSAAYPTDAAEAVQYQSTTAHAGLSHEAGKVRLQIAYDFSNFSFDNVSTLQGTVIDQKNRNSFTNSGTARGEVAISPAMSVFVQGSYDRTGYKHDLLPGVANRDSDTYSALAGVSFDITALARGSVGVGYRRRSYDSALYRSIGGVTAEMKIDYFLNELTTIGLAGRRIIEDSSFQNAGLTSIGGFIANSIALRIDHEVLRNLLLNGQVGYEYDKYQGLDSSLDIVRSSVGAHYFFDRNIGLGLVASHDSRTPHGINIGGNYTENRVQISSSFQM